MNELINTTTFQEDIAIIKDSTTKVFLVSGKILQGIQDNKKYKEVPKHKHKRALALTSRKLVRLIFGLLTKEKLYSTNRADALL